MKIVVVFEYSGKKIKVNKEFKHNRGAYLVKIYHKKSKEI